jgi:hypothetical protein
MIASYYGVSTTRKISSKMLSSQLRCGIRHNQVSDIISENNSVESGHNPFFTRPWYLSSWGQYICRHIILAGKIDSLNIWRLHQSIFRFPSTPSCCFLYFTFLEISWILIWRILITRKNRLWTEQSQHWNPKQISKFIIRITYIIHYITNAVIFKFLR